MKSLKVFVTGGLLLGLLAVSAPALAAPFDWHIYWMNFDNTVEQLNVLPKTATSSMALVGAQSHQEPGMPGWYYLDTAQFGLTTNTPEGADAEARLLSITGIDSSLVTGLNDALDAKASTLNLATTNGNLSALQNQVDALPAPGVWVIATTSTRSIVTGTGATGWQVSSTKPSEVRYSPTIVTTASIAGNSFGTILLEIAPTNSATSTDWKEVGRCTNGQALSLAITLQSVQTTACQLSAFLPQGYFAKLRSVTTSGTPSYTLNSQQEVLH